jgi:surface protein
MEGMFCNCSKLKSLDLSNFQPKSVTSTKEMFKGCSALEYLDISNFNFDSLDSMVSMFDGLSNIKYINIYNITNNILINAIQSAFDKDGITICQKEEIINNPKAIYTCYNPLSYIIVKYDGYISWTLEYKNGFGINETFTSRKGIKYIIKGNSKYKSNESLSIEPNDIIEIYFYNNITSLENFFDGDNDDNCMYIVSVDLSHFNSSLVVNVEGMFKSCESIEEINFNNFDTSSVTNMKYMFYQCMTLGALDLSHLNTSLVSSME